MTIIDFIIRTFKAFTLKLIRPWTTENFQKFLLCYDQTQSMYTKFIIDRHRKFLCIISSKLALNVSPQRRLSLPVLKMAVL